MSTYNYKILAFIIALKRAKRNSVILKRPIYKMAQKYGICGVSFKKYLTKSIELGYIIEKEDRYVIIKFKEIVKHFCGEQKIYFGYYNILRNRSNVTVKTITEELLCISMMDNVIKPQEYVIERKKRDIGIIKHSLKTDKKPRPLSKRDYARMKKLAKQGMLSAKSLQRLIDSTTGIVISSNRHASRKTGISNFKAGQVLSKGGKYFSRTKLEKYHHGCNAFNLEKLNHMYPKAWIIPLPHYDKIRVSFGSQLLNTLS